MTKQGIKAGLIDRLLGVEDPSGVFLPGHVSEATYVGMAARDIERLLNTRNARKNLTPVTQKGERTEGAAEPVSVADSSIVMYGVPDFSALSLSNGNDRQRLTQEVAKAIKTHDRRFSQVEVTLPADARAGASLHFAIHARLHMAGVASVVGFEACFESARLQFSVKPEGGRRA